MEVIEISGILGKVGTKTNEKKNNRIEQTAKVMGKDGKDYSVQVIDSNAELAKLAFGTPVHLRFTSIDYIMVEYTKVMFRSSCVAIVGKA